MMKKVLYTLLAMVSMLVTACSNEEIGIEVTYPKKDINLNISTSDAYDIFGITDYEILLANNPNYYIQVTSLLYDSQGILIVEQDTCLRQFAHVNHKFSVDNGKYTLLTISTVVEKKNYSYNSDVWNLVGKNNLSTISLEENKDGAIKFWYNAIFLASEDINVNKQDITLNVTPKQLGSLLSVNAYNFDKTNDIALILGTTGQTSGVKLNPTVKGKDRYYYKNGINKDSYSVLYAFIDESFTLSGELGADIYILEEATLPIAFGYTTKELWEKGSFRSYRDIYYSFEPCTYNTAAFYYVGDEGTEVNFHRYLGDGTDFDEWYNNAKAAYEEYSKNNNGNGNTTTDSWKSIGTGTYTDGIVAPLFGLEPKTYNVEIMEHVDSAGLYRIMNPYSNSVYPYADGDCAEEGTYLLVNACDPDAVFIPKQSLGMDWGYGEMSFISEGARFLEKYSFESIKKAGYFGSEKNRVITLPTFTAENSKGETIYYQGIMYMGSDGYYCGMKNGFRITLPKDTRANYSKFVCDLEKSMGVSKWKPEMISPLQNIKKQKSPKKIIKEIRLDSSRRMQE